MARNRVLPVYVSLEEAAEIASLSTRTIRRRISDGTIPAYHSERSNDQNLWMALGRVT